MAPIVQTATALEIDTPQFCLSLPGVWTEEEPEADNVVFCGRSGNRWASVSIYLFTERLSLDERKEVLQDLLETRRNVEHRLSKGEAEVQIGPPYGDDDLAMATAFSANPSMGLVSFTRLIADDTKALSIYWQIDGLSEVPRLTLLLKEFEEVVATAGLYESETE